MDTKVRQVDGVTVLDLSGKITLGEASGKLRSAVQDALSSSKKILLNLADVNYIDSAGLGPNTPARIGLLGGGPQGQGSD